MASVGLIPIVPSTEIDRSRRPPWALPLSFGICVPGRKIDVESAAVGRELGAVSSTDLRLVEDAWIDLLEIRSLLVPTPSFPPPGPGNSYPRWSHTYYLHQYTRGERKFYVVCSPDQTNGSAPAVTVVRLTSSPHGLEFPRIASGTYACAGNITSFPSRHVDLIRQPPIRSLSIDDMRRIAAAVAITHGLSDALALAERDVESILLG
ncbi:MAG: hypothetical protein Q7S41_00265 [Candidatus Limnocylindria bacterium]|nr:hypothetical protein [Candidatus Limnocylindria bacterium]